MSKRGLQDSSSFKVQAAGAIPVPGGGSIAQLLKSEGPVVTAVLLKADATIEEIQIDTTPQKQMVQKTLGGPFTFLGQYEEEGIILMCLREDGGGTTTKDIPMNQHKLQPPFDGSQVKGDILCLRVAAQEDEADDDDDDNDNVDTLATKSNDEFFLNYTMDEYKTFAARVDIEVPKPIVSGEEMEDEEETDGTGSEEEDEDGEEMEGESDEEDDGVTDFTEMLMGHVLQRFQQENGRMPDEMELQALQSAIAQKTGLLG